MYKIRLLNEISPVVHQVLSAGHYTLSKEEPTPDAILVRSADMHAMPRPDTLLAIARAGAGVNNIPLAECAAEGIVVFNTPGANANAVAELTMDGLLLASRDIAGGLAFAKGLKGMETADAKALTGAFAKGCESAYGAVMNPTEGTILSVIRSAAESAQKLLEADPNATVDALFDNICAAFVSFGSRSNILG